MGPDRIAPYPFACCIIFINDKRNLVQDFFVWLLFVGGPFGTAVRPPVQGPMREGNPVSVGRVPSLMSRGFGDLDNGRVKATVPHASKVFEDAPRGRTHARIYSKTPFHCGCRGLRSGSRRRDAQVEGSSPTRGKWRKFHKFPSLGRDTDKCRKAYPAGGLSRSCWPSRR